MFAAQKGVQGAGVAAPQNWKFPNSVSGKMLRIQATSIGKKVTSKVIKKRENKPTNPNV